MKIKPVLKFTGSITAAIALILISIVALILALLASGTLIGLCLGWGHHLGCNVVIFLSILGVGPIIERIHLAVEAILESYRGCL